MTLLALYRLATEVGRPLFEIALEHRARLAKEDPARLAERRGRPGAPRPVGPLVWLHGASVGEALAILPLLQALLAERSALQALVTTGTVTSARLIATRLPARARHQFAPVDHPGAWRSFFDHWRPQLALLTESELWPNLILEGRRRDVAMALINGRMSARSARRWGRLPGVAAELLAAFELCLAQSAADRDRLSALGARQVRTTGNLKAAAPPLPAAGEALAGLLAAIGGRPLWLAASTHPGEDQVLLEVHRRLSAARPEAPDDPRPAPSRARRDARRLACGSGDNRRPALGGRGAGPQLRGLRRRHHGRARPATIAWRRSPSSVSRWCRAAARTLSRRRSSVVRCCSVRIWTISRSWPRACLRAGGARRVADAADLAAAVALLLEDRAARDRMVGLRPRGGGEPGGRPGGDLGSARAVARADPRPGRCGRLNSGATTGLPRVC